MKKMLVIAALVVAAITASAEKRQVVTLYSTDEINGEQMTDSVVYVENADGSWTFYISQYNENGEPVMVAEPEYQAKNPLEHINEWQKGSNYGFTEMKVVWKEESEISYGKPEQTSK